MDKGKKTTNERMRNVDDCKHDDCMNEREPAECIDIEMTKKTMKKEKESVECHLWVISGDVAEGEIHLNFENGEEATNYDRIRTGMCGCDSCRWCAG